METASIWEFAGGDIERSEKLLAGIWRWIKFCIGILLIKSLDSIFRIRKVIRFILVGELKPVISDVSRYTTSDVRYQNKLQIIILNR